MPKINRVIERFELYADNPDNPAIMLTQADVALIGAYYGKEVPTVDDIFRFINKGLRIQLREAQKTLGERNAR